MANHYDEPITIGHLARLAGLSSNYLGEAFKKRYGQSATEYLTGLRIGRAKQLLRETDLVLRDIARQVGYSDEFYLSRKFKKEVGVSPSVYCKQTRRRIAVLETATIGHLLALGIIPVAAPIDPKWSPYYHYYYQSRIEAHLAPTAQQNDEDNMNKLRLAKTDILVTQEPVSESLLTQLQAAGIRHLPINEPDWRSALRSLAAALDRTARCDHWLNAYEAKASAARSLTAKAAGNDTFAVLRLSGDHVFLYTNRGIRDVLVQDLQLRLLPQQRALINSPIGLDDLHQLNPDRLLLLICPDAATRTYWLTLQYQPAWRRLQAIRQGRLYLIPSNPWFEYSAVAADRMLEEMQLILTGKSPNPSPLPVHGDSAMHGL